MAQPDKSLLRIKRLFNSQTLGFGASYIRSCGTEKSGRHKLELFAGHIESLDSNVNNLFLLEFAEEEQDSAIMSSDSPDGEMFREFARRFKVHHIWYVAPWLQGLTIHTYPDLTVSFAAPAQLFSQLLALPPKFGELVSSDVDVNGFPYTHAYQKRTVISPLSAGRRPEESRPLDHELSRWADSDGVERPLLLLGDRGSGKTWQLLQFCEHRFKLNRELPWVHAPAFYIPLGSTLGYLMDSRRSLLGLYGLLAERYPWFSVKWDVSMFHALLECNQIIVCFDGLDELQVQPSEPEVQEQFRRIVTMLPMGARFIISSRTTHFSSFEWLSSLTTWPGTDVGGSFRVFELAPLSLANIAAYTSIVTEADPSRRFVDRVRDLLREEPNQDYLTRALRRCSRQPALLARLVKDARSDDSITTFGLLKQVIERSLIEFNIDFERTRSLHLDNQGELRNFDTRSRVAFLGELAWFMAERRLDAIDLERLPTRLVNMFGLDSEAMRCDIRSQTVFELVESARPINHQSSVRNSGQNLNSDGGTAYVSFGFRLEEPRPTLGQNAPPKNTNTRVVRTDARTGESVAGAYFLAAHIAARLDDWRYIPGVALSDTLRYLGSIPLDDLTAGILRQMLEQKRQSQKDAIDLVDRAKRCIVESARFGCCFVFNKSLRFLMQNLELLGYVTNAERLQWDPWTPELTSILRHPAVLGNYEFVLVPGISSQKIQEMVQKAGTKESRDPFLLGVHEITNQQFARFVGEKEGADWAAERIARALRDDLTPLSHLASRTTEYHLYFWEEDRESPGHHRPPTPFLRHPVVYVSWYAAQDFCNWLSHIEKRTPVHSFTDTQIKQPSYDAVKPGYRLPTAAEWWWAAQGRDEEARYPWEILPYSCSTPERLDGPIDGDVPIEEVEAKNWCRRYRDATTDVLLASGKRTADVAYDDDVGPLGAIGLIGNVKEWVDDLIDESPSKRSKAILCGGTAHLGKFSFGIGYYAALFPENSNPDLGFRIARSLSTAELAMFTDREAVLAGLG